MLRTYIPKNCFGADVVVVPAAGARVVALARMRTPCRRGRGRVRVLEKASSPTLVVAVAGRGQRRSKGALWPGRPRRRRRARRPATATCVARACVGSRAPCLCKLSLDAVKKKSDLSFCAGSRPPAKSRRSRRSYRHGHPCIWAPPSHLGTTHRLVLHAAPRRKKKNKKKEILFTARSRQLG
jgi:hypothetical protein